MLKCWSPIEQTMKNKISLFFFLFTFCINAFSQLSIGLKAGGNYTNVIGSNSSGNKYRPGFHVGAIFEYEFANYFSFQMEGVYSLKGFRSKANISTSYPKTQTIVIQNFNVLYSYSYIDVPLMLNIHFAGQSDLGSYIGLGPQFSFLAGTKWDGKSTVTTINNATTPPSTVITEVSVAGNNKNGYRKMDFGVVLGFGSKWDSGIEYCIRGGYGLYNMLDPSSMSTVNTWRDNDWHNLVFSVSLGYMFGRSIGGMYVTEKRNHFGLGHNYKHNYSKKNKK